MAVGFDNNLKSQAPRAYQAPRVSDSKVQTANNNMIASSAGAGRAAQQGMGGRGMSSGRGQAARGQRAQDTATVQGYMNAARNDMDASQANASMQLAADNMHKMEQIGNQGLLNGLSDARQQKMLAMGNMGADIYNSGNRHRLSMDSMYLDKTPLLKSLLMD